MSDQRAAVMNTAICNGARSFCSFVDVGCLFIHVTIDRFPWMPKKGKTAFEISTHMSWIMYLFRKGRVLVLDAARTVLCRYICSKYLLERFSSNAYQVHFSIFPAEQFACIVTSVAFSRRQFDGFVAVLPNSRSSDFCRRIWPSFAASASATSEHNQEGWTR